MPPITPLGEWRIPRSGKPLFPLEVGEPITLHLRALLKSRDPGKSPPIVSLLYAEGLWGQGQPLCLPAELSFRFWQQEGGHGVLHQIGHRRVFGGHIEERNPSAVVQGAVADGQAVPKRQSWDLTNNKKGFFSAGFWIDLSWELRLCLWPGNTATRHHGFDR